jgi:hypothetical protein
VEGESEFVPEETNTFVGLYRNKKVPWTPSTTVERQSGAAGWKGLEKTWAMAKTITLQPEAVQVFN